MPMEIKNNPISGVPSADARVRSQPPRRRPAAVKLLCGLQLLLGAGGAGGGAALIADPSGEVMGMPFSLLERTPFADYLIPGMLLLLLFGILPLAAAFGLYRRPEWRLPFWLNPFAELHAAWVISLYIGFGLIVWITVQTYMMNAVDNIHVLYMILGLLIQAVSLLPAVQNHFRLDDASERR